MSKVKELLSCQAKTQKELSSEPMPLIIILWCVAIVLEGKKIKQQNKQTKNNSKSKRAEQLPIQTRNKLKELYYALDSRTRSWKKY